MSPASEGIQFKDNSLEERINERHKATEGREMGGGWVSLGPVASSKEDCPERVCFWKI
jgi:hypothetical protein